MILIHIWESKTFRSKFYSKYIEVTKFQFSHFR